MSRIGHLARRFWGSLSRAEPSSADVDWVRSQLSKGEWGCWSVMAVQDRRHSIEVARRFVVLAPAAGRAEVAAALLHDVGKQVAGLGTSSRVVATIIGPRTRRLRLYHDHERIGAEMLAKVGSEMVTIELIQGRGPTAGALARADNT